MKEIHATNATLSLAYNLCNTYFNAKKQLVRPMKDEYDRQLKRLKAIFDSATSTKGRGTLSS